MAISFFLSIFAAMRKHKVCNGTYDRVCIDTDEGSNVSWLTLTIEDTRCFYDQLDFLLEPNGKVLYLAEFTTFPKYRRNGYGKELLEYTLKEYGENIIYLGVKSADGYMSDENLIKLYESVGFKKIEYELPYQFMVYDKYGKLPSLKEKVVKFTPKLVYENGTYAKYKISALKRPYIKVDGQLVEKSLSMCALLKHRIHKGYCKLFMLIDCTEKRSGVLNYQFYPMYDKDGNEILIKHDRDRLHMWVSYYSRDGFEFEFDEDWGINQ